MNPKNNHALIIWIVTLVAAGFIIGALIKPEISSWYAGLERSSLTPPSYVFPIVWAILYAMLGACGSIIWRDPSLPRISTIKVLYVIQLILNLSWSHLFFRYHLTGLSLLSLAVMDVLVSILIWLAYPKIKILSILMTPYFIWILYASYLNLYVTMYN